MKYALLLIASLFFAAPAFAEEYEKGPNGGLMLDVAGIDAELMTSAIPSRSTSSMRRTIRRSPPRATAPRCSSSAGRDGRPLRLPLKARIR